MQCINSIDLPQLADTMGIISQINRLQIICLLNKQKELCVCDIIEKLGLKQNLVSHHINLLKNIGLLKSRREGKNIHYSINEEFYSRLKDSLQCIFNI